MVTSKNALEPVNIEVQCYGCRMTTICPEQGDNIMDEAERWDLVAANPPPGWLITKIKVGKKEHRVAYCAKCAALVTNVGSMSQQFRPFKPGMLCPKCKGHVTPRYCINTCSMAPTAVGEHLHVSCGTCGYVETMLCCDVAFPRKKGPTAPTSQATGKDGDTWQ